MWIVLVWDILCWRFLMVWVVIICWIIVVGVWLLLLGYCWVICWWSGGVFIRLMLGRWWSRCCWWDIRDGCWGWRMWFLWFWGCRGLGGSGFVIGWFLFWWLVCFRFCWLVVGGWIWDRWRFCGCWLIFSLFGWFVGLWVLVRKCRWVMWWLWIGGCGFWERVVVWLKVLLGNDYVCGFNSDWLYFMCFCFVS